MPIVDNKGTRIRFEIEGDGPPLVLHHGFTSRLEIWQQLGYTKHLRTNFTLIMFDSRGHGESDKPHDVEAYTMSNRVGDVVTILNELGIDRAHFFGYSMGGWVGFGMARYASEYVDSFVIGAAHPYPDQNWESFSQVNGNDGDGFIVALEKVIGEPVTPDVRPLIMDNDLQALIAAAKARPSLEDVLPTMEKPCLLFVGEADSRFKIVRECADHLQNVDFVSFPKLTHVDCFFRSDLVSPVVSNFLLAV